MGLYKDHFELIILLLLWCSFLCRLLSSGLLCLWLCCFLGCWLLGSLLWLLGSRLFHLFDLLGLLGFWLLCLLSLGLLGRKLEGSSSLLTSSSSGNNFLSSNHLPH